MILEETLQYLEENYKVTERKICSLYLTPYFTVVELDDGSVGSCMSYYCFPLPVLKVIRQRLTMALRDDPLLLDFLFRGKHQHQINPQQEGWALLVRSLRATVISALSAPILGNKSDPTFLVSSLQPLNPFEGVERALVIGFGGCMNYLASRDFISELHIVDLSYNTRRKEMESIVERYREQSPLKNITISDGRDTACRLQEVDAAWITGSALCNGSMDSLLEHAKACPRVIVQGQSASIHPKVLFDRGVNIVITTLKPRKLVEIARASPNGKGLRLILEGAVLPWIYLAPRKDSVFLFPS